MSEEVKLRGGRNLIKKSDPIYVWTGEHNVITNAGAFIYRTSPHYPAMYQIEVRAIDDSIVGAEFGWQWSGNIQGNPVIISKEWKKATAFLEEGLNIGLRVRGGFGNIELRHIKAEKGTKATGWTPAPEDLGLEYPGHVTHFGTYFKDNDMVTDELIEYPEELRGGRNLITGTNEPMPFSSPNSTIKYIGDFQGEKHVYEIINPYGYLIFHSPEKYSETLDDAKNGDIYIFSVRVMVGDIVGTASEAIYLGGKFGSNYININEGASLSSERFTTISRTAPIIDETKSNQRIHIRLNKYDKIYVSSKVKLEKGSTATPWTPAPEDLGLSYPHYITHFGTYFKESDIFEDSLTGGRNLIPNSKDERFDGSGREFKQYIDLAPILEKYGLNKTYSLSLEVKSLDPSISNSVQVYMQNGSGTKYNFVNHSIAVTKEFQRFILEGLTPTLTGMADTRAILAFYGRYDTGNFPIVRNVKLEVGDRATPWTPAPEDLGLEYPPSITYFEKNPQIQNVVSNEFVEFHKDNTGFDLRNPVDKISGEEIYTDKADDSVVHVEVDGKSYQNAGSGKNLFNLHTIPRTVFSSLLLTNITTNGFIVESTSTTSWQSIVWELSHTLLPDKTYIIKLPFSILSGDISDTYGQLYLDASFLGSMTKETDSFLLRVNTTGLVKGQSKLEFRLFINGYSNVNIKKIEFYNIQLEEGSTATDYELPAPSPDYPIDIHSLNDFDVVSSVGSENIFQLSKFEDIPSSASSVVILIKDGFRLTNTYGYPINFAKPDLRPAKTYTINGEVVIISGTGNTIEGRFIILTKDATKAPNLTLYVGGGGKFTSTFSTPTDFNYDNYHGLYAYGISTKADGIPGVVEFINIKIEEGKDQTPYSLSSEDISENSENQFIDKINLLLDEPLRSLDGLKDRLFRDSDGLWKIERNVYEHVFNGKEGFVQYLESNQPDTMGYYLTRDRLNPNIELTPRSLINILNKYNGDIGYGGLLSVNYETYSFSGAYLKISIKKERLEQLSTHGLKVWLEKKYESNKPVVGLFSLGTPTIETLNQELQNKLNNLRSFQDSNYVYTVHDKANNLSEDVADNLNRTIHATFKSEDYCKLAKDGLVYPDDITHLATKIKDGTMIVSELIEGGDAYGNSTTGL